MKLLSLFSGIGAFEKALVNLGIPYELVGYCEIDKRASASYAAIHNVSEDMNLGDITKVDEKALPKDIDLVTYGFPCQDISLAGKQKGLFNEDGTQTRSGLFFEALRIIEETKPRVAIAENVKNLVGKKFKEQFAIVLASLEAAGYNNYWKVLNAKDYGVPQNRERVFIVSIRKDVDTKKFEFPKGFPLKKRLKDVLEDEVDEKYYLSDKTSDYFVTNSKKCKANNIGFSFNPTSRDDADIAKTITTKEGGRMENNFIEEQPTLIGGMQKNQSVRKDGVCSCLTSSMGIGGGYVPMVVEEPEAKPFVTIGSNSVKVREATAQGYAEAVEGDSINLEQPNSKTRRGRVGKQVAQTLVTSPNQAVVEPMAAAMRGRYTLDGTVEQHIEISDRQEANAITTVQKDSMVAEPMALDEQNGYIRKDGCVGTITTDGSSPKKNNRIIEPLPINTEADGTARTIKSQYYKNGLANLQNDNTKGGKYACTGVTDGLRIRKLTPRECFRLMGFDDNDFEKAEAVNSNTQLYKQAGNSIVVAVVKYLIWELLDCGALYGPVEEANDYDWDDDGTLKYVEIVATLSDGDVDALKDFFRSRGIPKTNYTIY